MKIALLAALAALSLTTVARAEGGEGNGDPFPFHVTGVVTPTGPATVASAVQRAPVRTASVTTPAPRHP